MNYKAILHLQMELRGMLGSLMQFFLCLGFLLSYIIGPYTSYLTLILVSAGVPVLCILTFTWVPESPYYLLSKDRKEEALSSLQWLRGYPETLSMQAEIADIQVSKYFFIILKGKTVDLIFPLHRRQLSRRNETRVRLKLYSPVAEI